MSSDEKGISPAHKTSTPTHRSASTSTSSQRESRQVREEYKVHLLFYANTVPLGYDGVANSF